MTQSRIWKWALSPLALFAFTLPSHADVELPSIIGSNMVLQQNQNDAIWGWDAPGTKVNVSFRGQSASATADKSGYWLARVPAGAASTGPFELRIKGSNEVKISNVMVGEVWIAGGQSNMWWHVGNCKNAADEIKAANLPLLRVYDANGNAPRQAGWPSPTPQKTINADWKVSSSQNAADFPGVPFFFARELQQKLGVPVGIINTSVPGVEIEKFLSPEYLRVNLPQALDNRALRQRTYAEDKALYETAHAAWATQKAEADKKGDKAPPEPQAPDDPNSPYIPGGYYNGMISPVAPFTCKGFLWWQGEFNTDRFTQYRVLFPGLIQEWRQLWGADKAPFLFVELHGWLAPQKNAVEEDSWPNLRDAQRAALQLPATYEVSAIDILDEGDSVWTIHPPNKQQTGHRLFLSALANVYGAKNIEWSGPVYRSATFAGNEAKIAFDHAGSGLSVKAEERKAPPPEAGTAAPNFVVLQKGELKGFALAGADHQWHAAKARIDGASVTLSSDEVPTPVAARYDWANNPNGNLYNNAGLPAFPFRTDQWNLGLHSP